MTERNAYEPPTDTSAPAPPARPGVLAYNPSHTLVLLLTLLLVAGLVLDVVSIGSDLLELELLERMSSGDYTQDEAEGNDARQVLLGLLHILVYLPTVVVFAMFLRRASSNARALGAHSMRFTPGWVVGWFFVPIANLFKPYQTVREIWEVSRPAQEIAMLPALLPLWWAAWLASNLMGNVSFRLAMAGDDLPSLITSAQFNIATALVSVVCAVLALLLVRRLHAIQQQKSAELP